VLSNLGGEFIPALEEGDFAVETRVLPGSNLKTSIEYTQKAAHVLLTGYPEVEKVVTKIGSGEVPSDPMPMEAADLMVILKDKSEWTSAETFPELAEKMGNSLKDVPGITTGFQFPVQMRFNELMTGARQDVVCKIFGEDLDSLAAYAHKLGKIVGMVKGAQDLYIEPVTGMPQIVIKYNRSVMAQYNVNIADVNRVVNTAFAGQATGSVYEGEKRFDLVVRMENKQRSRLEDIQNLLVPTPKGIQIPLSQLAEVEIIDGPNQIQREETKRRIVIGFNVRGRDVQSIVEELQIKVEKQLKFSPGYSITFGGAFENLNEAKKRLSVAVPVSLALIFLLLFFAFSSVKQGLLIYTAIPLSAIGGIYFLALRGMPFSISAGVGFIALFGVAVLNGIVLIAEFNRLKESGLKDLHRIVIMGTKVRLRPVLMTAFVASLGFLPMAISHGAGAEVQRPLATVVIGGLLLATFLTLFVLPILYVLFEKISFTKKRLTSLAPILIILVSITPFNSNAQRKITLDEAYEIANKNNLQVKNKELLQEYQKSLINTSFDPGNTNLTTEMGQINSSYFDTKISLVQSFSFPTIYKRQKQSLTASWDLAVQSVNVSKIELKKSVAEVFYFILILQEKEQMLIQSDSIFTEFVRKAKIRFEKGESNVLEKTSAETQKAEVQMQLMSLKADLVVAQLQLQLLLNTTEKLNPVSENKRLRPKLNLNQLSSHPNLIYMQKQVDLANSNVSLEKSKLLPDLTAGYFNQSIQGVGADNMTYGLNKRFNGGQVALGIPIFNGAQKARIKAAGNNVEIAQNEFDYTKQQFQTELDKANATLQLLEERANYYETVQLANAELIQKTALKQFEEGEIDYMEWTLLNNQAIQIRNAYLDVVKSLNETTIYVQFLTNSL
jgi:cobalt-zinc-cadmium resistance protein CzcA